MLHGRRPDLLKSGASPGDGSNLLKSRQPLMSRTPLVVSTQLINTVLRLFAQRTLHRTAHPAFHVAKDRTSGLRPCSLFTFSLACLPRTAPNESAPYTSLDPKHRRTDRRQPLTSASATCTHRVSCEWYATRRPRPRAATSSRALRRTAAFQR